MPKVDRSLPQSMKNIAREAILHGFCDVYLGFEGLGSGYPADIGWLIHLKKTYDSAEGPLIVNHQIGTKASAYVGFRRPRWSSRKIHAWIKKGTVKNEAHTADANLMINAWANGWSVDQRFSTFTTSFDFSASNHFYNIKGHPESRFNGKEVSYKIIVSRSPKGQTRAYDGMIDDGGYRAPRYVDPEAALEKVSKRAPWYADVAYFDKRLDKWVL